MRAEPAHARHLLCNIGANNHLIANRTQISARLLFLHVHGPSRQPRLRVLVVERPRRHDKQSRQHGSRKSHVHSPREILQDETGKPRGNLDGRSLSVGACADMDRAANASEAK